MIHLTRINRAGLVINADLIEHVETTPDTVISLVTGQKFVVLESAEEVIRRVVEFRRAIGGGCRWMAPMLESYLTKEHHGRRSDGSGE